MALLALVTVAVLVAVKLAWLFELPPVLLMVTVEAIAAPAARPAVARLIAPKRKMVVFFKRTPSFNHLIYLVTGPRARKTGGLAG